MKNFLILFLIYLILLATNVNSQDRRDTEVWVPVPEIVESGEFIIEPPSDAIILFDGTSFEEWETVGGGEIEWELKDGIMKIPNLGRDIRTRRKFKDFQLHVEFRTPEEVIDDGGRRGNSGIFLQERYEIQLLDNWDNPTASNTMGGSLYKQHIPLANPVKRPGEWQTVDVFYKAPTFGKNGDVERPARVTALLNGVLILNNVEIFGSTTHIGLPVYEAHGPAGIRLQDYSHPGRVSFRNIWIRELDQEIIHTDGIRGGRR